MGRAFRAATGRGTYRRRRRGSEERAALQSFACHLHPVPADRFDDTGAPRESVVLTARQLDGALLAGAGCGWSVPLIQHCGFSGALDRSAGRPG
jgi:hypothetical protein